MTIGRRDFFTAIGTTIAALKMASPAMAEAAELPVPCLVISRDHCILCGFDQRLTSWAGEMADHPHADVMRCTDRASCQARQINALLGTRTPWQTRTGIVVANGEPQ